VSVSGRSVVIAGTAPSEESQKIALAAAEAVDGAGSVADRSVLLEIVTPYVWSASRLGRKVSLSGFVPSEGARNAMLAAGRRSLPDAEIVDGPGLPAAPSGSGRPRPLHSRGFGELGDGLAALTDGMLSVKGTACPRRPMRMPAAPSGIGADLGVARPRRCHACPRRPLRLVGQLRW
jgi:hypothetical protein